MFFLDALGLSHLFNPMKEKKKIFSFSFQSIINNKKLTENTFSCPGVNSSHTQLVLLLLQKELTSLKGTALFNNNNCRIVWEMLRNENTLHHVEILLLCWYYAGTVFSQELFYLKKGIFSHDPCQLEWSQILTEQVWNTFIETQKSAHSTFEIKCTQKHTVLTEVTRQRSHTEVIQFTPVLSERSASSQQVWDNCTVL